MTKKRKWIWLCAIGMLFVGITMVRTAFTEPVNNSNSFDHFCLGPFDFDFGQNEKSVWQHFEDNTSSVADQRNCGIEKFWFEHQLGGDRFLVAKIRGGETVLLGYRLEPKDPFRLAQLVEHLVVQGMNKENRLLFPEEEQPVSTVFLSDREITLQIVSVAGPIRDEFIFMVMQKKMRSE